jgi:hypothetical protein
VPNFHPGNSLVQAHLKGKVKSVTKYFYRFSPIDGLKGEYLPEGKDYYEYDKDGNLSVESYYDGKTMKMNDRYVYKNNAQGNPIQCKRYDGHGDLYATYDYTYDSSNFLVKKIWLNDDGSVRETNVYKNDTAGRALEIVTYKPYYKTTTTKKLVNDNMGNWIEERSYNAKDSLLSAKMRSTKYDDKGNLREYQDNFGQTVIYDENGEVLRNILALRTGTAKYRYEYSEIDKEGNWLEKTSYEQTEGASTKTKRVITYFK